jgi:hypothetical protein
MANPNIVSVSTINGKTAVANVTTVDTTFVENTAESNKVYKINAILISNITSSTETIDLGISRSNVSYYLTKDVSVPSGSTLDALNKSIYLNEGDYVFISASANSSLHAICSYEEIS